MFIGASRAPPRRTSITPIFIRIYTPHLSSSMLLLRSRASAAHLAAARRACSTLRSLQNSDANETWDVICEEAEMQIKNQSWRSGDLEEFGIDNFLQSEVLDHNTLAAGLANSIGGKLMANQANDGGVDYNKILLSAFKAEPEICSAVSADINRFKIVDPACDGVLGVYLFYKGVQALACARVAHHFWTQRACRARLEPKGATRASRASLSPFTLPCLASSDSQKPTTLRHLAWQAARLGSSSPSSCNPKRLTSSESTYIPAA